MGIFKSLKGKAHNGTDPSSEPSSPPTGGRQEQQYGSGIHDELSTREEKRRLFGGGGGGGGQSNEQSSTSRNPFSQWSSSTTQPQNYSRQQETSHSYDNESFVPPPGPPPSHGGTRTTTAARNESADEYAAPPGPLPSHLQTQSEDTPATTNPPPYHDWTVIPDTALFPPPPAVPNEFSPTNNASYDSAAAAHAWCAANPMYTPAPPNDTLHNAVNRGDTTLQKPAEFHGTLSEVKNGSGRPSGGRRWRIKTKAQHSDAVLLGALPMYFAACDADHPLRCERAKTIYFETKVDAIRDVNSAVAVGFAAKPYPGWRLPGWQRASVGVHGDDGRRFVNDAWGGRDFVDAFRVGDVVGIGMRFEPDPIQTTSSPSGSEGGAGRANFGTVKTKVFFTRNGRHEGGWDMDEERDAERDEGVEGLQGEMDMYPAVGVFGGVDVEIRFGPEDWLFKPA